MILSYEQDGWRFVWRPLESNTVKIRPAGDENTDWTNQMEPPDLEDEDGNPFTFRTILRDFETDCKSWLLDYEAER